MQASICACTCIVPIHADAYSHAFMQKYGKLRIRAYMYRPSTCACTCIAPIHADAYSHAYRHTHMQKYGRLGIRAYMYRPSIRACTCILSIHADAYSYTLSTNAEYFMWNTREPIWMGTERGNMNETRLYLMLHMTMSQVCWHAELQGMYLLCKSLYTAGFAQGTNTYFLPALEK